MKRIGPAVLLLAASLGVAFGQQSQPAQPAANRSSYDPMAHAARGSQPKGIVETTLAGVNPHDKDYGRGSGTGGKRSSRTRSEKSISGP